MSKLIKVLFLSVITLVLCTNTVLAKNFIIRSVNYFYPDSLSDKMLKTNYEKAIVIGCEDLQVKNAATAAVLGVLPGFGSFYTRELGLGIADILTYPISPFWDSPLAWKRARRMNMRETVEFCDFEARYRQQY